MSLSILVKKSWPPFGDAKPGDVIKLPDRKLVALAKRCSGDGGRCEVGDLAEIEKAAKRFKKKLEKAQDEPKPTDKKKAKPNNRKE